MGNSLRQSRWIWSLLLLALLDPMSVPAQRVVTLIAWTNHVWRYDDTGTNRGSTWRTNTFNDSGWSTGSGLFGVERSAPFPYLPLFSAITTPLAIGPTANVTTNFYFRATFQLDASNLVAGMVLVSTNFIDDGAVLYLNGLEVGRIRVPANQTAATYASGGPTEEGTNEVLTINTNLLRVGANVLAVEVHQNGATSSDIVWGHTLLALVPDALAITSQPQSQAAAVGSNVTFTASVSGTPPIAYRWQFEGADIPGANEAAVSLTNVQFSNAGAYRLIVTNASGSATSSVANLTVGFTLKVLTNGLGSVLVQPVLAVYPSNSVVSLTAIPTGQLLFLTWSGSANVTNNPLTITMDGNKDITAIFGGLTINVAVLGNGVVTRNPDRTTYSFGEQVTLSAIPGRWHGFNGWESGAVENPRLITVVESNNFSAFFSPTTAVETVSIGNASRLAPVGMPAILIDGQFITNGAVTRLGSAQVEMLTTFVNGTVLYTSDGSPPSLFSSLYFGPVSFRHTVTLRATAWDANFLNSWEADPVTITILPVYSVNTSTAGGGSVTISPVQSNYLSNSVVTINAMPDAGWTFLQWLGDVIGNNPTATLMMTRNKCVEAVFGTALSTVATGDGTVNLRPSTALYPYGTVVHLTAIPQPGNAFALWGNAGSGTNNPLHYPVTNANRTVSSVFAALPANQHALTVLADGAGSVTRSPAANRFNAGATVSLTAMPEPGQSFLSWVGDASGMQNPLTVTMNSSKVITANFTKRPRLEIFTCGGALDPANVPLQLHGVPGQVHYLGVSSNLIHWSALATVTNIHGTVQWNDTNGGAHRFYQSSTPPPPQ